MHHFAFNTRLLHLADAIERPIPASGAPNLWKFHITPNRATRALDAFVIATAHTPLGWPIVFIGLAFGVFIASRSLPNAQLIAPIALSSLFYGCGYLVFSVASELRYHLWTELAALIATVLLVDETTGSDKPRLACAFAPAGLIVLVGAIARELV